MAIQPGKIFGKIGRELGLGTLRFLREFVHGLRTKIFIRLFKLTEIRKYLESGSISKHDPVGGTTEEWLLIRVHVAVGAGGVRFA